MPKVTIETKYAAELMTRFAIEQLASNLAAYMVGVERVDGTPSENGAELVSRLLALAAETPLAVDMPGMPRDFDREEAMSAALENIGNVLVSIRRRAL